MRPSRPEPAAFSRAPASDAAPIVEPSGSVISRTRLRCHQYTSATSEAAVSSSRAAADT